MNIPSTLLYAHLCLWQVFVYPNLPRKDVNCLISVFKYQMSVEVYGVQHTEEIFYSLDDARAKYYSARDTKANIRV